MNHELTRGHLQFALHLIFLVYNIHLKIGVNVQNCWTVFQLVLISVELLQKVNHYIDVFG